MKIILIEIPDRWGRGYFCVQKNVNSVKVRGGVGLCEYLPELCNAEKWKLGTETSSL